MPVLITENAIQHSPDRGEVGINVHSTERSIELCVVDKGQGIPEEAIDLIFDKFVQVSSFQNAEGGNIGLGLAIAREIVKAHQGQIWCESKSGKGSRFCFKIPISREKSKI